MAQEVGVAYVTLLPSGRGFGKAVEGQINDAVGKSEKKTSGFFSKVGKGLKVVGGAVAGVVTAVGAIAVTGGISRALNIEDAQAKLKGLGHDTKAIEAIMTDALASVKGTAFGLDTAATVAATAVAAGIEPGKELEKYLRLTADAATIAGVSMEEMGSILNKATTAGKVYTQELNQLADRGLPIFQWLQEEYGVTAEELRKMVAAGKIDAETFRKVIEENIGGAALASGDTTRGAFANMRAALSRLGLAFVEDGVGGAKSFFQEVTIVLDDLTGRVGPIADWFSEKLGGMFQVEGSGQRFLDFMERIADAVQRGPLPGLLQALQPILPALAELGRVLGTEVWSALTEVAKALEPIIPILAESLTEAVVELAPVLGDLIQALLPILPPLAELIAAVAPFAADIMELLIPALKALVEEGLTPTVSSVGLLADLFSGRIDAQGYIDGYRELGGVFEWLRPLLEGVAVWVAASAIAVHRIFWTITDTIVAGLRFLGEIWDATWKAIGLTLGGNLKSIVGFITGDMDLIKEGMRQGLDAVQEWWGSAWSAMETFVGATWGRLIGSTRDGVNRVVGQAAELGSRVLGAMRYLPGRMVQVGREIIDGLIRGVHQMIHRAVAAVRAVGGAMLDGVKSFLGIASPSRVFRDEVGKMVGLGLLEGVGDTGIQARIDRTVSHMVSVPDVPSSGGAGPSVFHLYDENGTLMATFRGMLGRASRSGSSESLNNVLGTR